MKYLNVANPYPSPKDYGLISLYDIILIMFIIGIALILLRRYLDYRSKRPKYIGNRKLKGWKSSMPFYRVYCDKHGYYETYLMGWEQEIICPKCISERDEENES